MSQRGHTSVEWLALLAVMGGALVAGLAGALPHAPAVPRAVGASFERAFCLVSGGDCLGGRPRPCVVRSHRSSRSRTATLAVLRLGDGRTVLREERSDGSVVVSVEDGAAVGGELGIRAELTVAGRGAAASATLAGDARGGRGRRFVAADADAADRLLERLGAEASGARAVLSGGDDALAPDERWWAVGEGVAGGAELRAGPLGGSSRLAAETVAGIRERVATGERTYVLRSEGELVGALTAPLSRVGAGTPAHVSAELAFDRAGEPASLTVRAARGVHGEAKVGPWRSSGGRLLEAEARLDLADPVTRELARSLLSPSRALPAARALAARLLDRARIDVRLFATGRREAVKGVAGALFVKAGYEVVEVVDTGRLVDAAGREPGMGWARRLDCVRAAA